MYVHIEVQIALFILCNHIALIGPVRLKDFCISHPAGRSGGNLNSFFVGGICFSGHTNECGRCQA